MKKYLQTTILSKKKEKLKTNQGPRRKIRSIGEMTKENMKCLIKIKYVTQMLVKEKSRRKNY